MIATMLGKCVCVGLCACGAAVSALICSQIYTYMNEKSIEENKSEYKHDSAIDAIL